MKIICIDNKTTDVDIYPGCRHNIGNPVPGLTESRIYESISFSYPNVFIYDDAGEWKSFNINHFKPYKSPKE